MSELLPDENIPISNSVIKSSNLYIQHSNLGGYTSANEFPANQIIEIASNVTESDIANLPAYGELAYVITATYNGASNYSAQIYFGQSVMATRIKAAGGWQAWSKKANYDSAIKSSKLYIQHSNLGGYTSANDFPANQIIEIASNVTETDISNLPAYGEVAYIVTLTYNEASNYSAQIYFGKSVMATRIKVVSGWQAWSRKANYDDVTKAITAPDTYATDKNITKLSQINDNVIFLTNTTKFPDCPFDACIFKNTRYSQNYNIQEAYRYPTGQYLIRITGRDTGEPYNNMEWMSPSVIEARSILSMGDSICYGGRNSHKGFLGDLGIPRNDRSYPGARLSNTRITKGNEYCIFQQFIDFVTDDDNADYYPDILIADGGINDYGNNVVMGSIPNKPVLNDTEAEELNKSTISGGIQYLFYNWIKYYPNAKRFFLLTHRDTNKPWTKNYTNGYTQTEMNEVITEICNIYGVKVIDIFNNSFLNSAFSQYVSPTSYNTDNSVTDRYHIDNDGVHPLALGYKEGYIPLVREALKIGTHTKI